MKRIKLKADMRLFDVFIGFVEESLKSVDVPQKSIFSLMTVSEEIIVNIINYAYAEEPGELEIDFEQEGKTLRFTFKDSGTPFDPLAHTEVDTSLQAHERDIGGLGIHMVKSMTDNVTYAYQNGENVLVIEKVID